MKYSITPKKHQLRSTREKIDRILQSYSPMFELESIEITLGWQQLDRETRIFTGEDVLNIVIDKDAKDPELERHVLRGLAEIEFMELAEYKEIEFNWQEIARFAYVENKVGKIMEENEVSRDLEIDWQSLRGQMSERVEEADQDLYVKASFLGRKIGEKLIETHELKDLPKLNHQEFKEAGDQIFSGKK